jgi:hypothetical protein
MESSQASSPASPEELALIAKHLGQEGVIVDANFKTTAILKETEAHRRRELVSDVEYEFSLALKHGDYYLGQAKLRFYVEQIPSSDEELFVDS